jgi:hypothetical protein
VEVFCDWLVVCHTDRECEPLDYWMCFDGQDWFDKDFQIFVCVSNILTQTRNVSSTFKLSYLKYEIKIVKTISKFNETIHY